MAQVLEIIAVVTPGRTPFPYLDAHQIHDHPMIELTRRGLKVFSAFANGWTNKQVAPGQEVSLNAMKFLVKTLYAKMTVHDRAQAMVFYLKS